MTPVPTIDITGLVAELRREADAMHAAVAGVTLGDTFHAANWRDKPHRVLYDALKHMRSAASALEASNERIRELEGALEHADKAAEAGMCQFSAESKHLFLRDVREAAASAGVQGGLTTALSRKDTPDV